MVWESWQFGIDDLLGIPDLPGRTARLRFHPFHNTRSDQVMQTLAVNWTAFGYGLAAAFAFGILYAILVRKVSRRGWIGQTAWSVVVGVTFVLITMIPAFGLLFVALVFCYFAAAGGPMIIEYLDRVQKELQQDKKNANDIAKDLLK